ncbi:MAG: hypothetical protein J5998_09245 [Clostridia bacterium]|nr:hypothetical protein [Clostridia bacterium]
MRELQTFEAACILGGVDKKAQDALYTIGYFLGVIARFIGAIFVFNREKKVA